MRQMKHQRHALRKNQDPWSKVANQSRWPLLSMRLRLTSYKAFGRVFGSGGQLHTLAPCRPGCAVGQLADTPHGHELHRLSLVLVSRGPPSWHYMSPEL
jgi:hypothetical protein